MLSAKPGSDAAKALSDAPDLKKECQQYLLVRTIKEKAETLEATDRIVAGLSSASQDVFKADLNRTLGAMEQFRAPLFESFWSRVRSDENAAMANPAALKERVNAARQARGIASGTLAQRLDQLATQTARAAAEANFEGLPAWLQQELAR